MTAGQLIDLVRKQMRDIWEKRSDAIQEVVNGEEVDEESFSRQIRAATSAAETFIRHVWPRFREATYVEHEKRSTFTHANTTVVVKPDFVCRAADGRLCIVDWKTGGPQSELPGREQLAIYTLWAVRNLALNVDEVRACIANLRSGQITDYDPTPEDLVLAEERIRADVALVERYSKEGFPPTPEVGMCRQCRWLERCPLGQEASGMSY